MAKSRKSRALPDNSITWQQALKIVMRSGGTRDEASVYWKRIKKAKLNRKKKHKQHVGSDRKKAAAAEGSKVHQFQPGNTASVGYGRPRGPSLRTKLKMVLSDPHFQERLKDIDDPLRDIVETMIITAINGDVPAAKWLGEQLDGKIPDKLIADIARSGPLGHVDDDEMESVIAARNAQKKREAKDEK